MRPMASAVAPDRLSGGVPRSAPAVVPVGGTRSSADPSAALEPVRPSPPQSAPFRTAVARPGPRRPWLRSATSNRRPIPRQRLNPMRLASAAPFRPRWRAPAAYPAPYRPWCPGLRQLIGGRFVGSSRTIRPWPQRSPVPGCGGVSRSASAVVLGKVTSRKNTSLSRSAYSECQIPLGHCPTLVRKA
jgi:hypothetical protein